MMFVWVPLMGQLSPFSGNVSLTFLLLVTVVGWIAYEKMFTGRR